MLATRGYALTITARDEGRLREAARLLAEDGVPDVTVHVGDMADEDHLRIVAEDHASRFSARDALVLDAGVGTAGPIDSYPLSRLDKTWQVNLRAPFVLLQSCLPSLRAAARRHPGRGARVAALLSLVNTFNAEEASNGVSGSAIAPGYVETEMSEWVREQIPAE